MPEPRPAAVSRRKRRTPPFAEADELAGLVAVLEGVINSATTDAAAAAVIERRLKRADPGWAAWTAWCFDHAHDPDAAALDDDIVSEWLDEHTDLRPGLGDNYRSVIAAVALRRAEADPEREPEEDGTT